MSYLSVEELLVGGGNGMSASGEREGGGQRVWPGPAGGRRGADGVVAGMARRAPSACTRSFRAKATCFAGNSRWVRVMILVP